VSLFPPRLFREPPVVQQVAPRKGPGRAGKEQVTGKRYGDTDAQYGNHLRSLAAGGPIKRIGRARFVRNVMIAIGNAGDRALVASAVERLDDESPLVRGAAIWALAQVLSRQELSCLASERLGQEGDAAVIEEWRDALAAPLGQ